MYLWHAYGLIATHFAAVAARQARSLSLVLAPRSAIVTPLQVHGRNPAFEDSYPCAQTQRRLPRKAVRVNMLLLLIIFLSSLGQVSACGAGRYCASENLVGSNQCENCPAGFYCPGQVDGWFSNNCWGEGDGGDNNAPQIECRAGRYSSSGSKAESDCTVCGAGKYSSSGSSYCTICGAGKYSSSGYSSCTSCGAGKYLSDTYSIGASNDCIECADGGHSLPGSSACEKCITGKYYDETEKSCKLCPKNTFTISGAADISGCAPCEDGGHSQPGSGYCEKCSSGKYFEETEKECKLCPSGTFTASGGVGIEQCEKCQEGFYGSSPGASTCYTCGPGKYTNLEQTDCLSCAAGKISGVASSSCTICEEGKYAGGEGKAECLACQAGKYASADNTECLSCPAGKISGVASSECTACETGKFAEGEGNVECSFCDTEEVLKGSITATNGTSSIQGCICPKGKFKDHEKATCETVPEGVRKDIEGMNVTSQSLEFGYWRTSATSRKVYQCLSPDHCVGGDDIDKQCKEGHQGPKCGVCSDGFASTGSGETLKCNKCEGGNATQTIIIYLSIFATVIVLAVLATCCSKKKKNDEDEVALTSDDGLDEGRTNRSMSTRAERTLSRAENVMEGIHEVSAFVQARFPIRY